MSPERLLESMRGYFKGKMSAEALANLENESPRTYLKESLEVVDFIVHIEDEIGQEIDITEVGKELLSATFGQLAAEIHRRLVEGGVTESEPETAPA